MDTRVSGNTEGRIQKYKNTDVCSSTRHLVLTHFSRVDIYLGELLKSQWQPGESGRRGDVKRSHDHNRSSCSLSQSMGDQMGCVEETVVPVVVPVLLVVVPVLLL